MTRRALFLLILVLLVAGGTGAYLFLTRDTKTTTTVGPDGEPTEAYGPLLDARESLLSSPRDVELELAVDIPKNSDSENPMHQQFSAEGGIDFASRNAELVYDFNGLANVAGYLGHFDTLDVVYVDGTGYLEIFTGDPAWLSIEPTDASEPSVRRLREVMMTTPLILPGLLEAAAAAPTSTDGEDTREVDPASLSASDDELVAGLGSVFEELGVESVQVETSLGDGGPTEIVVSFEYRQQGRFKVEATYGLDTSETEVTVEAPEASEVRTFSSIFG